MYCLITDLDGAPAMLMQKLRYKAEEAGSLLMELPTKKLKPTQRCCQCGATHKMELADRTYSCECGSVMDRDENAARTMSRYAAYGAWWENIQCTRLTAGTVVAVDGFCPS
jgi:transposase